MADIGERDGQRQEKQECPRDFIHDGMRRQKGFAETIAPQEAEDFQDCDPEDPQADPRGKGEDRKQFDHGGGGEDEIGGGIEFCAGFSGGAGFSGDGAVDHVGEAAEKVETVESGGKNGQEEQNEAEGDAAEGDKVCDVFFHWREDVYS